MRINQVRTTNISRALSVRKELTVPTPANSEPSTITTSHDGSPRVAATFARLGIAHEESQALTSHRPSKTVLDNGLTILTDVDPNSPNCTMCLLIKAGPINSTPSRSGMAHLVEHMLAKGTQSQSTYEVAELIDSFGGEVDVNAFTYPEFTLCYAQVLSHDLRAALGLHLDMLFNPRLEGFANEKRIVLEEIREDKDTPGEQILMLLDELMWRNHPLGAAITGTEAFVEGVQRRSVVDFMRRHYTPDRIIVSVAGNFDPRKVIRQIRSFEFPQRDSTNGREAKPPVVYPTTAVKVKPTMKQTHLVVAAPGVSVYDDDRYTQDVLDYALTRGWSSRLFYEVRTSYGFAYTVGSVTDSNGLAGTFGVYTATESRNAYYLLTLILGELEKIKTDGLDRRELRRVKLRMEKELVKDRSYPAVRAFTNAIDEYYYKRAIPIEEEVQGIEDVTLDDIHRYASTRFTPDQITVVTLGPRRRNLTKPNLEAAVYEHISGLES